MWTKLKLSVHHLLCLASVHAIIDGNDTNTAMNDVEINHASVHAVIGGNDTNAPINVHDMNAPTNDVGIQLNNPTGHRVKRQLDAMDLLASLAGGVVTYHQLEIFHNKTQVDKMETNVMLAMDKDNISLVRGQIMYEAKIEGNETQIGSIIEYDINLEDKTTQLYIETTEKVIDAIKNIIKRDDKLFKNLDEANIEIRITNISAGEQFGFKGVIQFNAFLLPLNPSLPLYFSLHLSSNMTSKDNLYTLGSNSFPWLGTFLLKEDLYIQDFCRIKDKNTAYQVFFILTSEVYRSNYRKSPFGLDKAALLLDDEFYALLRSLYREKFGERFRRVVMMGYLKHEDGLVVNSAVLLHQHVLNKVDVEDVWRKKAQVGRLGRFSMRDENIIVREMSFAPSPFCGYLQHDYYEEDLVSNAWNMFWIVSFPTFIIFLFSIFVALLLTGYDGLIFRVICEGKVRELSWDDFKVDR